MRLKLDCVNSGALCGYLLSHELGSRENSYSEEKGKKGFMHRKTETKTGGIIPFRLQIAFYWGSLINSTNI
jgi:hypothetical protein